MWSCSLTPFAFVRVYHLVSAVGSLFAGCGLGEGAGKLVGDA